MGKVLLEHVNLHAKQLGSCLVLPQIIWLYGIDKEETQMALISLDS